MVENIIRQYDFNLAYAHKLVKDLSPDQMTTAPFPGFENHPAFTLGHLITGSALTVEDTGGKYELPEGWSDLFLRKGPGDPRLPSMDIDLYPGKEALLKELEHQHEKLKLILRSIGEAELNQAIKWRFASYMPRLKDILIFMCVNHEAMHLGQLAGWRRAMGLPSALARL